MLYKLYAGLAGSQDREAWLSYRVEECNEE